MIHERRAPWEQDGVPNSVVIIGRRSVRQVGVTTKRPTVTHATQTTVFPLLLIKREDLQWPLFSLWPLTTGIRSIWASLRKYRILGPSRNIESLLCIGFRNLTPHPTPFTRLRIKPRALCRLGGPSQLYPHFSFYFSF